MRGYYKLPIINYRIATHEGAASHRLASQVHAILLLTVEVVPDENKKQFIKLKRLIEDELSSLPNSLMVPVGLRNIRNSTAVKYIKLLLEIELKTIHR